MWLNRRRQNVFQWGDKLLKGGVKADTMCLRREWQDMAKYGVAQCV